MIFLRSLRPHVPVLRVSGNPTGPYLDPPRDAHPQRRFLAGLPLLFGAAAVPELGRRFGASKNSRMLICVGKARADAETRAEVEAEAEPEACLGETVAAGWAEAEAESGSAFGRVASTADAALG